MCSDGPPDVGPREFLHIGGPGLPLPQAALRDLGAKLTSQVSPPQPPLPSCLALRGASFPDPLARHRGSGSPVTASQGLLSVLMDFSRQLNTHQ